MLDEGSLNGTYYGVNKISCKSSPQIIEGKSIFYLGEEAFLAKVNYKEGEQQKEEAIIPKQNQEPKVTKSYRCSWCEKEFQEKTDYCPNCDRYNTLIDIYE